MAVVSNETGADIRHTPNPMRRTAVVSGSLGILFLAGVFVPSLLGLDMMDAGFGLAMLSGFAAMAMLVTAGVYFFLARKLDALFSGKELIGYWRMDAAAWRDFVACEYDSEKMEKRGLWKTVVMITPLAALAFYLIHPEAGLFWTVGFPLLLLAFLWCVAVAVPLWRRRRRLANPGLVILGRKGAWLGGIAHAWNTLGCRLISVCLADDNPNFAELHYGSLSFPGPQEESFRLPLPTDSAERKRVMDELCAIAEPIQPRSWKSS